MTQVALLAAVVIWGWTFVATKICLEQMGTLQLVACRFLLGAPALYTIARIKGARFPLRSLARPLALAAAVFSAHYLLQTWALEYTTATNSGWIVAVSPIAIALLAALLLKERISRSMKVGIGVASFGIVMLVSRGRLASLGWLTSLGDWMALTSTFSWGLYTILTRDLSRRLDPVVVALSMTLPLAATALFLPFVWRSWTPLSGLSVEVLAALGFLAFGGVALAQWFWQVGVAKIGAAKAGLYLYLEPLATTALAVPLLSEPFGLAAAAGGALVLSGVFVAQRGVLE